MKCNYCGSELISAEGIQTVVKSCPFCGAMYDSKPESVKDVLRWAVNTHGIEIFRDDQKLNSLLADLMPKSEKERKKIRQALFVGVGSLFYQILKRNNGVVEEDDIKRIRRKMEEDDLTPAFSTYIINCFLYSVSLPELTVVSEMKNDLCSDDGDNKVGISLKWLDTRGEKDSKRGILVKRYNQSRKINYQKSNYLNNGMWIHSPRLYTDEERDVILHGYRGIEEEFPCPCGSMKRMSDCHLQRYSYYSDEQLMDELIPLFGCIYYPERYPDDVGFLMKNLRIKSISDIEHLLKWEKIFFIAILHKISMIPKGDLCSCMCGADFWDCHGFLYQFKNADDIDHALLPIQPSFQYQSISFQRLMPDWFANYHHFSEVLKASDERKIHLIAALDRGKGEMCLCGSGESFDKCHCVKYKDYSEIELNSVLDMPQLFDDEYRCFLPSWIRRYNSVSDLYDLDWKEKCRVLAAIEGVIDAMKE